MYVREIRSPWGGGAGDGPRQAAKKRSRRTFMDALKENIRVMWVAEDAENS